MSVIDESVHRETGQKEINVWCMEWPIAMDKFYSGERIVDEEKIKWFKWYTVFESSDEKYYEMFKDKESITDINIRMSSGLRNTRRHEETLQVPERHLDWPFKYEGSNYQTAEDYKYTPQINREGSEEWILNVQGMSGQGTRSFTLDLLPCKESSPFSSMRKARRSNRSMRKATYGEEETFIHNETTVDSGLDYTKKRVNKAIEKRGLMP